MVMRNLEDAFVDELKDLLSAEKQLIRALPKMAKKAHSSELKQAFEEHLKETEEQAHRLERAFESLGRTPRAKRCEGMSGIVEEGEELMQNKAEPGVLDAALIAAAQKVEHYEIASYGTVCTWADMLGFSEAADLLKQTLAEEKQTNDKLSKLAKQVNIDAKPE